MCADELKAKIEEYRQLAADDTELTRWVLYNLMVYAMAIWGTTGGDKVSKDLKRLQRTLAGIRADINTTR